MWRLTVRFACMASRYSARVEVPSFSRYRLMVATACTASSSDTGDRGCLDIVLLAIAFFLAITFFLAIAPPERQPHRARFASRIDCPLSLAVGFYQANLSRAPFDGRNNIDKAHVRVVHHHKLRA